MAQKNRSSGCETNKRTSSIRNPSKTSLLEMHEASYSVHRMRRCEEEQNFITWLPERESEWKVRRELCKFGGVWEGGGRFMIHPFYLCIIRAMKLIFDSTCSDFALGGLVARRSSKCPDVVTRCDLPEYDVFHVQVLSFMRTDIFYNLRTIIHFPLTKGSVFPLISWLICNVLRLVWCRTGGGHVQWRRLVCYVQPYLDTPRKLMMLNMQIKP